MVEKDYPNHTKETDSERSTAEIRQDIARGEEKISETVEQLGERIKEKLDWHEYIEDAPYVTLGIAAGLGFLASRIFRTRTTPTERIIRSVAEELRHTYGNTITGVPRQPGFIKVTLLGIASKYAVDKIKNATLLAEPEGSAESRHGKERRSATHQPEIKTQIVT